ncbi:MAG TPA: isoprenylcysteine carboxylmethyltransferase family protein [Bacteroidota bacterium]|nr:isoprenylcysteine carboxylmethyltransferase family protein [Bacteroidota bacterium]
MDILGKSPIPIPMFIVGKLAFLACALFIFIRSIGVDSMLFESAFTRQMGLIFYVGGLIIVIAALLQLGQSAAVGIPAGNTELKTHGLYSLSRNPVYTGAFIMCIGSCLYSLHLINLFLLVLTVAIHHWIIIREEVFLEQRFGRKWNDYNQRVPRYIGRIKRGEIRGKSE